MNFSLPNRLPTAYRPEGEIVSSRLAALEGALDWAAAAAQASPWVQAVRENPPPFWAMESLLREYPLSSAEGLALMRLAEALLRIPDADTAIALTADQLSRADFEGSGNAALTRLSSAAISMSKHFLPDADRSTEPGLLAKLGAKTVVTATLRAVQLLGKQFVLGQTIDEALDVAHAQRAKSGVAFSFDMLGEGSRTQHDADVYLASYANAIKSIAHRADSMPANGQKGMKNTAQTGDGISIKLSALHPRYEWAQQNRVMHELVPRVWQLCEMAALADMNLTIDAEEVDRLELSLNVFEALVIRIAEKYPHWSGFGLALQSYQTRAVELIQEVARIARQHQVKLMCRLVKGAYWDAEIKRAQELGLPHYPVFTHKHHTDVSYLACAAALLTAKDVIYPQFATHNAATIAAIMQLASRNGAEFELQRLHGMGEGIYREVLKNPLVRLRIYAPVGAHRDLLAYLVRRLLENGANSSFVHQLADVGVRMDELLASPLHLSAQQILPLPADLFGTERKNSAGFDLADETHRAPMLAAYATAQVPAVPFFEAKEAIRRHKDCADSYQIWSKLSAEQRAAILQKAADVLEAQMPRFCALLVKEAHKTWGDAVAEVREAVDFLRYYAVEAQRVMQPKAMPSPTGETNELRLKPRGVWVCISPWNFPLAIFLGQVAAALATGNTVLAKPAEQTPYVAIEAAKLLHLAGVPEAACQVLHGPGETVGAALVTLPNIAGVVFTGSTQVAKIINRALAAKDGAITPLIAETGGINAMVVDSSALPEQVVDAAIQSAFKSAGQRCSALRLLCVHHAIADKVIEMLQGAASELTSGDPAQLSTDVGPLIDAEAYAGINMLLEQDIYKQKQQFAGIESAQAAPNSIANLLHPHIVELHQISDLKHEVFAPVLHVVRYGQEAQTTPQQVIEQINALGYGLTLGIQTRIDSRAQQLAQAAHIGNVYINRNMIGAVVGVQPFGGEGLSGTGPKAGGPHYLYRFCAEQTVTVNTAAAGGNAALLSGH
ncbi:L-glutamate gamma-semialdehyde dehydrogenase [Variovorax sp. PCZ-1]|uniref:L-glutamate gamma-semialdehyde dehydrogenase n=1 Tax=Variovorax sp. PCZ-1 TaxID=2835533 RepID=UPI001BCEC298|nr:L-glutamate gamma-semialdehyde dehydrogenase [Variovorax sp. PCZ-1]MBS7807979.1 L-glutamate gamma-semialdehyde dehydrogenase [Variovorax sp. PCZ-1]